eukprot:CFRG2229T1
MFTSILSSGRCRLITPAQFRPQRVLVCMSSTERKPEIKRFYKEATVKEDENGNYNVLLDSRLLKTPKRKALALPSKSLAMCIAAEWNGQQNFIRPHTMHMTSMANSAIDQEIMKDREVKLDLLVEYLHTDTVCFRSSFPTNLTALQMIAWDPYIQYFNKKFGVNMQSTMGLEAPKENSGENLIKFREYLESLDMWQMAAMENAISMCHSAIIATAVMDRHVTVEKGIKDAYLEAEYQRDVFGRCEDEDVLQMHEKSATLAGAALLARLSRQPYVVNA